MKPANESNWRTQELSGSQPVLISKFVSNKVKSTRYKLLTLVPKNLMEQFQRSSNLWFLLVSVFQLIPFEFNPVDSWTTVVPLAILITMTLLKDAYNDYYRGREDYKVNHLDYSAWGGTRFSTVKCQELLVGSIVLISEGQSFPADVVVLGTRNERVFYLDTSRINGETDLMCKKAVSETHGLIQSLDKDYVLSKLAGVVNFEQPNNEFSKFKGKLKLSGHPRAIQLFHSSLAYRGSILKGTEWVIGVVIYTGLETKTYLNINKPPLKTSEVEKSINRWVVYLLIILLVLVIFSVLGLEYISVSEFRNTNYVSEFVMFTILYNNIIPISLFVTMDILRILQTYFIMRRVSKKVDFNTGDINENLGQVEYIFTDKTGTLTENTLKVELCIINNVKYKRFEEDTDRSQTLIDEDKMTVIGSIIDSNKVKTDRNFNTHAFSETNSKIMPNLDSNRSSALTERPILEFNKLKQLLNTDETSNYYQFIKCMAICNTVQVNDSSFTGISRDEIALVEAAQEIGIKLVQRTPNLIEIEIFGVKETIEVLAISPFDSSSKMSRILVRSGTEHFLYIKGSYDKIVQIIKETGTEDIESQYQTASRQGLRTILLAYKKISKEMVDEFMQRLQHAKHTPVNSEGRVETSFIEIESEASYLGIAGIEDSVKAETIDTLKSLQRAGIKIWVLSGDNEISTLTTARKVGLIKNDSYQVNLCQIKTEIKCVNTLMKLISGLIFNEVTDQPMSRNVSVKRSGKKNSNGKDDLDESIHLDCKNDRSTIIDTVKQNNAEVMLAQHPLFKDLAKPEVPITDFLNRPFSPDIGSFVVNIDRESFLLAIESNEGRKLLSILLLAAKSVFFFGLLPLDKARVVKLVKENFSFRPVTLAIGDGNGDIPMIQAADVGVGIMNEESQAKSYSDLAISHFSLLKELLLLHGHWNYSRMSRSVLLFIYKNVLLIIVTFSYIFISDYSGQSVFNSSLIVGYNIGFTTLPILVLGVFDEDMLSSKILDFPELYSEGLTQVLFNWKKMLFYMFLAFIDGILIPIFFIYNKFDILNEQGMNQDQTLLGTCMYIAVVFAVLIQIALDTFCYSWLYIASHLLSILVLAVYLIFVSLVPLASGDMLGAGSEIIASPTMLLSLFFIPLILLSIHLSYTQYQSIFRPGPHETVSRVFGEQTYIKRFNRLGQYSNNLLKAYRETRSSKSSLESDAFELKATSLQFNSEFIEAGYRDFYILENIKFYKIVIILLFVLLVFWTFLEAFVFGADYTYNLIRGVMCAGFFFIVLLMWTEFFISWYVVITVVVIFFGLMIKFATEIAFLKPGALATCVIPAVTYVLFNVDWVQITCLNVFNMSLYIISISIYYSFTDTSTSTGSQVLIALNYLVLAFSISITSAYLGYYLERSKRLEYKLISLEKIDIDKSQRILSFLLPGFVKKRVKDGARYIAEDQGTVTVFFCDIVDFDSICTEYEPKELVEFLDTVFQKFDQLSSAIGVTKIETVGKTYMACAGLKDSELELDPAVKEVSHARRAIELGLAIISLSSTIRLNSGLQLQVKIGINSGPVTAGVVGHHKPQFSLVGDTINTASRMCSTIESANTIQISKDCYDLIENLSGLEFIANSIEAKGKGLMHTFIVTESKTISPHESINKLGLNHMTTLLQHSSFARSATESAPRIKRRTSELLTLFDVEETQLMMVRSDTELLGGVKFLDFSCSETNKQRKFRINKTINNQKLMFSGLTIALVNFSLILLLSIMEFIFISKTNFPIVIARSGLILILTVVIFVHSKIYLNRLYPILMLIIFFCMMVVVLLDLNYTRKESDLIALEVMYIVLLLHHTGEIPLSKLIPAFLLIFIPWGILGGFANDPTGHAANCAFVIVFSIINSSAIYTIENHLRTYFNLRGFVEREISKTDKLLTQMMPPHVLENMRQDRTATDSFKDVTLLYADIVGFTAWSSDKPPKEVVGMLSELFTRFDKKCLDHNVYKVHTIGDCYVVMGLMHMEGRDISQECLNVVNMGKSMIKVIKDINEENGSLLNMRIGIHVGEIIAGITGTNIVRYDIYGPDVLMANKMESGGLAGSINVSDVTKDILEKVKPGMFSFEFNKEIYAKVINQSRKSYFLRSGGE